MTVLVLLKVIWLFGNEFSPLKKASEYLEKQQTQKQKVVCRLVVFKLVVY